MIFKTDQQPGDLNGFLDRGSQMVGELHFDTTFRVDGKFTGKAVSSGDLVVGEGGEIEGEIEVGRLFVSGVVRGKVRASRQVQLAAGGKAFADLTTPSLVIEDGAQLEGRCSMGQGKKAPAAAEAAPVAQLVPPRAAVKERRGA